MQYIVGVVLAVTAAMAFYWSLPRGGKTAWFVGKEWEGYAVVTILMTFALGIVLALGGFVA